MARYLFHRCSFAIMCAGLAFSLALARIVDWVLAPFRLEPLRVAVEGPAIVIQTPALALSPALLNSLRHEAGARSRSSARKT